MDLTSPSLPHTSALFLLILCVVGCSSSERRAPPRAGGADAGFAADAGAEVDAGPTDGGNGAPDAGMRDGGRLVDAGMRDAGMPDAGMPDAGMPDAGTVVGGLIVLNEVVTQPGTAEFIEIYNPTGSTVALGDHYLSDNAFYWEIATGIDWRGDGASDFVVGFPAGASIAPGGVVTITASDDFETTYGMCPDYRIPTGGAGPLSCAGRLVPDMVVPVHGSAPVLTGVTLSNDREMVVLFRWNGVSSIVMDVDYLTWGSSFTEHSRVDKTAVVGYRPDTTPSLQRGASPSSATESMSRCMGEHGEIRSGGNGVTGHDEMSEHLDLSFQRLPPSPGRRNDCP